MNKRVRLLLVLCSAFLSLNLSARKISTAVSDKAGSLLTIAPVANFTSNKTVICAGDSISFTDLSTNTPTAWLWTFTGGTPTTSTVQNPTIVYNTPGTYAVKEVVSNGAGSDSLTIVNYITVNANPVVATNPSAAWICKGDSTILTASGALTYAWKPTTGLSCPTCAMTYSKVFSTTTYTVVGTNASGCSDSAFVTVNVGSIIVTLTGSAGTICQGNSDTLTATGGTTYLWSTGATTSSIIVTPSATTTYSVMGYSLTCKDSASIIITVNPAPTITVSGKDTICQGGSTTLTASGAVNYFWAPSSGLNCTSCPNPVADPTVTTTYTVIGVAADGCSNAQIVTVYVIQTPTVTCSPTQQTICTGESATITALGSPFGGTYEWFPGGSTNNAITVSPTSTTIYSVTYKTFCDSVQSTSTVTVAPSPDISLSALYKSGCVPLCDLFTSLNTTPGVNITSYLWLFGDGDSSSQKDPSHCFEKPGTYGVSLTVTTSDNCDKSTEMGDSITVYALPKANYTYTPDPATILDPLVNFTDISSDAYPIRSYWWNFGDTNYFSYEGRDPSHTYGDTGYYCPRLAVTDIHGCSDTITQCFDINTQYSFYIPNAFDPDCGCQNDVFTPKGTDVSAFEMYIFDRWGLQLYHTTSMAEGWNGKTKSNGPVCQEDAYVYVINVTDNEGKQHHFTGVLYLVK